MSLQVLFFKQIKEYPSNKLVVVIVQNCVESMRWEQAEKSKLLQHTENHPGRVIDKAHAKKGLGSEEHGKCKVKGSRKNADKREGNDELCEAHVGLVGVGAAVAGDKTLEFHESVEFGERNDVHGCQGNGWDDSLHEWDSKHVDLVKGDVRFGQGPVGLVVAYFDYV